jgi:uncharacterized protein (TIGR02284 family)
MFHTNLCIKTINPKNINKMENKNENIIKQLNKIVEINNDRIEGYETANKETTDSSLKSLFTEMASRSRGFKSELAAEVRSLGGTPEEGTKNTGKLFRIWMDVKAALTDADRKKIIASCERGEDSALQAYDEVIKSDAPFSETQRSMISRQRTALQGDHDKIKSMRDAFEDLKVK